FNIVTLPMPFTVREIESPDAVTRVAAADAALRPPEDDIGEKMVLNMGPSHPATHGVLRLVLELDGEIITKATPDIGFLHRGDEKIAENMQYNQFVPYTDRLDYLAPLSNNVAYALAVEKLMGWEVPPRGKAIRTICCETSRISSHLMGIGAMALDLGAMTVFLYTFTEREKLYNLFELLTGARFTTSYTRVGGQIRDLPENFIPQLKELIDHFIVVTEGLDAPPGEIYFAAENPKGELGFYINSRGGGVPYRLKIRTPSFVNLSILPELLPGCMVSDVPAVLGSLDFVMGECDR